MESYARPNKRRKLDEVHDLPGPTESQYPHEPSSQVTYGERKRNIPQDLIDKLNISYDVTERLPQDLIDKLNISYDVTERLRRLTKFCGKAATAEKIGGVLTEGETNDGSNYNREEMTNGNHNEEDKESATKEIGCNKYVDGDCERGLPPLQNIMKGTETAALDNEDKFKDAANNVEQAAPDVLIFKQVLKEIIEQRTKVVEEKVAENSLKLQNRIRELERENRELQWTARRIFAAFRQLLIENEKRKEPKTSRGVQVSTICESASEKEVSERTLHITTAAKVNGVSTILASTTAAPLTSIASKVVTLAEDPQPSLQAAPRVLFDSQQPLTEKPAPTAVVYTVKPRLAQLAEKQNGTSTHNRLHVPRPSANESTAAFLQVEPGQSSESIASRAFSQPPPALQNQAKSLLELIRENQLKLSQQTERLERQQQIQQQRTSHPLVQSTQHHPSETTASLLQQLQRQQQLQQRQQHYQKLVERQPHKTLLPTSSQITDQVTPTLSVFSSQKQRHSTPEQQVKSQSQLVRPSDESQEKRPSANSSIALLQQRDNSAIYHRPSPSHMHFVVNSQTKTSSVPSHPPIMFNTKQIDEVLKRNETALPPNGKSPMYMSTPQSEPPSQSTSSKQAPINLQRSNLTHTKPPAQEVIKHHVHHERHVLSAQPAAEVTVENAVARGQTNTTLSQRLVSTDIFHARPKSVGMQKHAQHPSSQLQNMQSRPPPQVATQMQNTTETRREHEVSSSLSTAIAKHKPIQSDVSSMPQTILVPARKKHTSEELLPSGYRFSLPSPEYLLQRRKLYEQTQNRAQPLTSQSRQVSMTHSLENKSSNERIMVSSTHSSGHAEAVYTMQSSNFHTTAIPTRPFHQNGQLVDVPSQLPHTDAYNPFLCRPSDILLSQKKQNENLSQSRNQLYKPLQGQEQGQLPTGTDGGGNLRSSVPSLHRPPIQSPGISSSDPRIEKNPREAEKSSMANSLTRSSLSDHGDALKPLPKPSASIAAREKKIVLSWNMEHDDTSVKVDNYELFACQDVDESKGQPIKWKKIGIVKALPLPMACTLTQFSSGSKYFFSVRAVDEKERAGPFSDPCTVSLSSHKVA